VCTVKKGGKGKESHLLTNEQRAHVHVYIMCVYSWCNEKKETEKERGGGSNRHMRAIANQSNSR
jgi:hypothetical protein